MNSKEAKHPNKEVATVPIYKSDLEKIRKFRDEKKLRILADAIRVCIEFTDSHGGLE
jgi:hypothetical protein